MSTEIGTLYIYILSIKYILDYHPIHQFIYLLPRGKCTPHYKFLDNLVTPSGQGNKFWYMKIGPSRKWINGSVRIPLIEYTDHGNNLIYM